MYKINDLYDLTHSQAKDYLSKYEYPWQALKGIKDFIIELGETLGDEYQEVNEHVWIHKDAKVFDWFTLYYWCRNRSETLCFYQRKCISRGKLCYW